MLKWNYVYKYRYNIKYGLNKLNLFSCIYAICNDIK